MDAHYYLIPSKNAKWPFSLSQNKLYAGGWSRDQNRELERLIVLGMVLVAQPINS